MITSIFNQLPKRLKLSALTLLVSMIAFGPVSSQTILLKTLADVRDNAVSQEFFQIPEIRSENGRLEVHLFIREDPIVVGTDTLIMRHYTYEHNGQGYNPDAGLPGPWGPTLRVKPSDRLSVILHNRLEEEPEREYIFSMDTSEADLLVEGKILNDLTTVLIIGSDGEITCGNLKGAEVEVIEEDREWIIYGREVCQCPPGQEGTCDYDEIIYSVIRMYNPGQGQDMLRVYRSTDHHDDHNIPHNFNTTNLHAHGFHVSPFQDDIFRHVGPGYDSYYTYDLDEHTPGTMWYHPHIHGSTALQVASGMSGALIIDEEGPTGIPELDDASTPDHERIMIFNQIVYDEDIRELPDFHTLSRLTDPPMGTTVNGRLVPNMRLQPGEVQRWRMVHSGYRSNLALFFPPEMEVFQISVDGIMFDQAVEIRSLHMSPGNRCDVLVRVKEQLQQPLAVLSENYNPMCEYFPGEADCQEVNIEQAEAILRVIVEGEQMEMGFPGKLPGPGKGHETISEEELDNPDEPRKTEFDIFTDVDPVQFVVDSLPFEEGIIHHELTLGEVEQWQVTSGTGSHPYHIHINPFQVVEFGGKKVDPPMWKDVILVNTDYDALIYTRYLKFWGDFVMHCHILDHEDQGMMQRIRIKRSHKD